MYILSQDNHCLINTDNISHIYVTNHYDVMVKPIDGIAFKMAEYKNKAEVDFVFEQFTDMLVPSYNLIKMPNAGFHDFGCPFDEMGSE